MSAADGHAGPRTASEAASSEVSPRRLWAVSALVVLLLATSGVAVGYGSFDPARESAGTFTAFRLDDAQPALVAILSANLSSALLLFSGYLTLGLTSVAALMFISTYVGATFHAAAANAGAFEVAKSIVAYAPFEFGGLLLAAVAGLLPSVHLAARLVRPATGSARRLRATRAALVTLGLGVTLILVGGVVETLVIAAAHSTGAGGL